MLPPLPSGFPSLSACDATPSSLESSPPFCCCQHILSRREGSVKPTPARRRPISAPALLPNSAYSLVSVAFFQPMRHAKMTQTPQAGTCQLSATVSICLDADHIQTRPQILCNTQSANQEHIVSDTPPLAQLYHEPSLLMIDRVNAKNASLLEDAFSLIPLGRPFPRAPRGQARGTQ